ncbi:Npt1/Npt2 family nucleotide transporter [Candidatus Similichlamydia epinepheli]|uniref:Npt1/Npt2 family nucleotide transporter n=1 Tax=Candidatus Similichlamydia epinepheli TaxID=1903953 RepID=UPI000D3791D1|nr:Npt1/Npt2 family nucleotide transporter [Candidatus Similichlamydia epinepheli]
MTSEWFRKFRAIFWPVFSSERPVVVRLMGVFFFCGFSYHTLRQIKDNILLVSTKGGMEVVPFIKGWMLFPLSFLSVYLFSMSEKKFKERSSLVLALLLFSSYFLFFLFFIYPNRDNFAWHSLANLIEKWKLPGLSGMADMIRYWHLSIFYVVAELWGSIIIQVALWGFANEIVPMNEAKRIYVPLNFALNISGVAASWVAIRFLFNQKVFYQFLGEFRWEQGLKLAILCLLLSGVFAILLIKNLPPIPWTKTTITQKKIENDLSFTQRLRSIFMNPYTFYIAVNVFSFHFLVSTLELFWKEKVRQMYDPTSGEFSLHISCVSKWISLASTFSCFFLSGEMIQLLPWRISFLLTPILVCTTAFLFFLSASYPNSLAHLTSTLALSPLQITIFLGDLGIFLSRTSKYVLFDIVKEFIYLPLERKDRIQVKTVTDGLVSRGGKIVSSIMNFTLIGLGNGPLSHVALIHLLCSGLSIVWIHATSRLSTLFQEKEKEHEQGVTKLGKDI